MIPQRIICIQICKFIFDEFHSINFPHHHHLSMTTTIEIFNGGRPRFLLAQRL